jgi:hypothetical protein
VDCGLTSTYTYTLPPTLDRISYYLPSQPYSYHPHPSILTVTTSSTTPPTSLTPRRSSPFRCTISVTTATPSCAFAAHPLRHLSVAALDCQLHLSCRPPSPAVSPARHRSADCPSTILSGRPSSSSSPPPFPLPSNVSGRRADVGAQPSAASTAFPPLPPCSASPSRERQRRPHFPSSLASTLSPSLVRLRRL